MVVVVAVGVPGVGKTTVLNRVIELAEKEGLSISLINFGDVMVERAVALGLIKSEKDRDKVRKLPLEKQIELQKAAALHINELSKKSEGVIIVDTHIFIRTPTTYFPGIPKHILEDLQPRGFLVITAPPEDIINRRRKDVEVRERDVEEAKNLKLHQELTIFGAAAASIFSGSNLTVIENKEGGIDEAAQLALNALKSFIF